MALRGPCRLAWLALGLLFLTWRGAMGQDWAAVLPEIRKARAPTWLVGGLRMSYYSAAATVPASMYYFSPNEEGDWQGGDGKRWDRFEQPGGAGQGISQIDVVAVDDKSAILSTQAWGRHLITGPLVPGARASLICPPGGGDWWIHPDVLAKLPNIVRVDPDSLDEMKILRMSLKIPTGKVHKVIRFQYERQRARHIVAYDVETGMVAYKATLTQAPPTLRSRGSTLLTEMWILRTREVKVPWAGAALPENLAPGKSMRYEGTTTVKTISSRPLTLRLSTDMKITARGRMWMQYEQTTTLASPPGAPPTLPETLVLVSATGQLGGVWIAPEKLRALRSGEMIDQDPVTGEQVTAICARDTVTLTAASKTVTAIGVYDLATGALTSLQGTNRASELVTTTVEARLTRWPSP